MPSGTEDLPFRVRHSATRLLPLDASALLSCPLHGIALRRATANPMNAPTKSASTSVAPHATVGFRGTVDTLPTSTFKCIAPRRGVDHATLRHLALPRPRLRQIWHPKSNQQHQRTRTKTPTRTKVRHLPTLHALAETTTSTVASEVLDAPCFLTSGNYGQSLASTCLSIRSRLEYSCLPFINSSRRQPLEHSFVAL